MSEVANQIVDSIQSAAPVIQSNESTGGANTDVQPPSTSTPPPKQEVSSKLEILIRREAAALNRENAAKAREAELEAKLKRIEEFEGAKGNSKKALELLGLNYDELTKSILQDGEIPAEVKIKKVEEKFDKFREEQRQDAEKSAQLQKAQAEEREKLAISNFKGEIGTFLKGNTERYELIAFEGQDDLVFEVIDTHYNRTIDQETGIGKVMSISEAADKVEQHLEEKYNKAKNTNKVKTLWGAIPKATQEKLAQAETKTSQTPKTLTNNMSATATKRVTPITDEERVQKAIAYARGLRP